MPHPDAEHSLRIQLATALRDLEEEKALAMRVGDRAWAAEAACAELKEALAAARRECEGLRAENGQLRELLQVADEVVPSEYRDLRSDITAALAAPMASGEGTR